MLWIIISIIVVAIDQITKYTVVQNIKTGQMNPVIDHFFYLTLHRNTGGAWSILQDSRILFLVVIPIVSAVIIYIIFKTKSRFLKFILAMVLGGAIGNYIDRLFVGSVTDFLLFYIGTYPFPIFNVADMSITCGTFLLAIYMIFIYKEPPKAGKTKVKSHETALDMEAAEGQDNAAKQEAVKHMEVVNSRDTVNNKNVINDKDADTINEKEESVNQDEIEDAE